MLWCPHVIANISIVFFLVGMLVLKREKGLGQRSPKSMMDLGLRL